MATVRTLNDRRDGPLLVCVPSAGHGPAVFRGLARRLARTVQVVSVGGEDHPDAGGGSASAAAAEIRSWGDRPTAVFGHSAGGFVALHLAALLAAHGPGPPVVVAAPPHDPGALARWSRRSDDRLIGELVRLGHLPASACRDPRIVRSVVDRVRRDLARAIASAGAIARHGPELRAHAVEVWRGRDDPLNPPTDRPDLLGVPVGATRWFDGGHFFPFDRRAPTAKLLERRVLVPRP